VALEKLTLLERAGKEGRFCRFCRLKKLCECVCVLADPSAMVGLFLESLGDAHKEMLSYCRENDEKTPVVFVLVNGSFCCSVVLC
jgi:hypothetical protein